MYLYMELLRLIYFHLLLFVKNVCFFQVLKRLPDRLAGLAVECDLQGVKSRICCDRVVHGVCSFQILIYGKGPLSGDPLGPGRGCYAAFTLSLYIWLASCMISR